MWFNVVAIKQNYINNTMLKLLEVMLADKKTIWKNVTCIGVVCIGKAG
jgi:hypothetical protein